MQMLGLDFSYTKVNRPAIIGWCIESNSGKVWKWKDLWFHSLYPHWPYQAARAFITQRL